MGHPLPFHNILMMIFFLTDMTLLALKILLLTKVLNFCNKIKPKIIQNIK